MDKILDHQNNIVKQMEKMPFWKKGFFEIMCVERIWKVYEKACVGKVWDRHIEFRKILDLSWEGILKDLKIHEKYLLFCDNSFTDNVNDDLDSANNIIVCAVGTLLDEINNNNINISRVISRNFDFLDNFLYIYYGLEVNKKNDEIIDNHELMMNELNHQKKIINKLKETNLKNEFYIWARKNCGESILGNFWYN